MYGKPSTALKGRNLVLSTYRSIKTEGSWHHVMRHILTRETVGAGLDALEPSGDRSALAQPRLQRQVQHAERRVSAGCDQVDHERAEHGQPTQPAGLGAKRRARAARAVRHVPRTRHTPSRLAIIEVVLQGSIYQCCSHSLLGKKEKEMELPVCTSAFSNGGLSMDFCYASQSFLHLPLKFSSCLSFVLS